MKNKLTLIVSVTVLICAGLLMLTEAGASTATAPEEEWNKTFGGTDSDVAYSVQQTSDGGYIIGGTTYSYDTDDYDVWLIKVDSKGKKRWDKTFGGDSSDKAYSVQQTTDGGYVIAGYTWSYVTDSYDVWLIKTDSHGNKQWDKTFGGSNKGFVESDEDLAYSVQQTSDGGYIIAGYTQSYGAGSNDVWLIKTDSGGNELWDKTFGGVGDDEAFSAQQTTDGGYVIAGVTRSYGVADAWLIKTDTNGNKEWDKTFGDANEIRSIQQTPDGGYIIAGANACLFIKTDSDGNKQWNKTIGEIGGSANSVRQTSDGGYIIAGTAGPVSHREVWLVKTDSNGNKQWQKTLGGRRHDDLAHSVQQTTDGGYIIAGETRSYGVGRDDVWLIKLEGTGTGVDTTTPAVTAPDIEKPPEKSIPGLRALGAMFGVFAIFFLRRRGA